jgi:hypothetical protein
VESGTETGSIQTRELVCFHGHLGSAPTAGAIVSVFLKAGGAILLRARMSPKRCIYEQMKGKVKASGGHDAISLIA